MLGMKNISQEAMLYELREGLCLLGTADEQYSYLCNQVNADHQYEGIAIGLSGCLSQVRESTGLNHNIIHSLSRIHVT